MSIPEDSFTLNSLKFDVKSSNDIESINQENGNSKINYLNGDTYEGPVNERNMKQGIGKYTSTSIIEGLTLIYNGKFQNDQFNGGGDLELANHELANHEYRLHTVKAGFRNNELFMALEIHINNNGKKIMINLKPKKQGESHHSSEITYLENDSMTGIRKFYVGYISVSNLDFKPHGLGRMFLFKENATSSKEFIDLMAKPNEGSFYKKIVKARSKFLKFINLGQYENGLMNGYGARVFYRDKVNSLFLGFFVNNKMNRYGKSISIDFLKNPVTYQSYLGYFDNDNRQGNRSQIIDTKTKTFFTGVVENNSKRAGGTLYYDNNSDFYLYNGEFGVFQKKNKPINKGDGLGVLIYKSPQFKQILNLPQTREIFEKSNNDDHYVTLYKEILHYNQVRKQIGTFGEIPNEDPNEVKFGLLNGYDMINFESLENVSYFENGKEILINNFSEDSLNQELKNMLYLGEQFFYGINGSEISIPSNQTVLNEFENIEDIAINGNLGRDRLGGKLGLIEYIEEYYNAPREIGAREIQREGVGIVGRVGRVGGRKRKTKNRIFKKNSRKRINKTKKRKK